MNQFKLNLIMKYLIFILFISFTAIAQNHVEWVSTTQNTQWKLNKPLLVSNSTDNADIEIQLENTMQTIEGFGTCFNELGWTSLAYLKEKDRENIMRELFSPNVGANFTICRMPIGANDFSTQWYSYNETDGDFEMKNFSINHDQTTLIPFIKNAQKYNPELKLWASPWSPPTWMKYNKHYASRAIPDMSKFPKETLEKMRNEWGMDFTGISNGLTPDKEIKEGKDSFIQEEKYFKSYANYFSKFIEAYRTENIRINMVMPQNEFNSDQVFPSSTWTATGLSSFLNYLSPAMRAQNVDIFIGTLERANQKLIDTILTNHFHNVKGIGIQWAGKGAISTIHQTYPHLKIYQSEQECGNGLNDWKAGHNAWDLMKLYLKNGTNAYMYWNTSLKKGGISTWGWHQNSLVSVDTINRTYTYNYEYYILKHLSHYVKPNAKRVETKGDSSNILAFLNEDKSVVMMIQNETDQPKTFNIKIGDKIITPTLAADSYNTFLLN